MNARNIPQIDLAEVMAKIRAEIDKNRTQQSSSDYFENFPLRKPKRLDLQMLPEGPAFEKSTISNFRMPSNAYLRFIPSFLVKALEPHVWVRPAIDHESCTMCNVCVINCPQDVIYKEAGRLKFDYDNCIKCMCCHELCPHRSVYLEKSLLARLIG